MKRIFYISMLLFLNLSINLYSSYEKVDLTETIFNFVPSLANSISSNKITIGIYGKAGTKFSRKYFIQFEDEKIYPDRNGLVKITIDINEDKKEIISFRKKGVKIQFSINYSATLNPNEKKKLFVKNDYKWHEYVKDKFCNIYIEKTFWEHRIDYVEEIIKNYYEIMKIQKKYLGKYFIKPNIFITPDGPFYYCENDIFVMGDFDKLNTVPAKYFYYSFFIHEFLELNLAKVFNFAGEQDEETRWIEDGLANYMTFIELQKIFPNMIKDNMTNTFQMYVDKEKNYNLLKWRAATSDNLKGGEEVGVAGYYISPLLWSIYIEQSKLKEKFPIKFIEEFFKKGSKGSVQIINNKFNLNSDYIIDLKGKEAFEIAEKKSWIHKIPQNMVFVPKGKFYFGEKKEEITFEHSFFCDIYEASNKQYHDFLIEIKSQKNQVLQYIDFNYSDIKYNTKENEILLDKKRFNYPVTGVTFLGAKAFAEHYGKRLPTEEEWERVAGFRVGKSSYPWGNEWDPKKCNWEEKGEIDGYKETSPIDSFTEGKNKLGVYNLVGNVWEWVDTGAKNLKYHKGGCYKYSEEFQTNYSRLLGEIDVGFICVGFRCVKDIEY